MVLRKQIPKCDVCKKSSVLLKELLGCFICPVCDELIEKGTYARKLIARIGTLKTEIEKRKMGEGS